MRYETRGRYRPGDFYRICDRTGFKVLASKTRKEWNGLIVRNESWEPRHPQDFVRGVADYQTVPEPRPRPKTEYVKIPIILTLSGNLDNYGIPLYKQGGGFIYRQEGLGNNEVPIVRPEDYPPSNGS